MTVKEFVNCADFARACLSCTYTNSRRVLTDRDRRGVRHFCCITFEESLPRAPAEGCMGAVGSGLQAQPGFAAQPSVHARPKGRFGMSSGVAAASGGSRVRRRRGRQAPPGFAALRARWGRGCKRSPASRPSLRSKRGAGAAGMQAQPGSAAQVLLRLLGSNLKRQCPGNSG